VAAIKKSNLKRGRGELGKSEPVLLNRRKGAEKEWNDQMLLWKGSASGTSFREDQGTGKESLGEGGLVVKRFLIKNISTETEHTRREKVSEGDSTRSVTET